MIPFFDAHRRRHGGARLAHLGRRLFGCSASLKRPHLDYFREFYADTALFGAGNGLFCGLDFFGGEHVVFSTDAPLGPVAKTIAAIDALDLDAGAATRSCARTRNG